MKRNSIVTKLFAVTTLMFVLFLLVAMACQALFFQRFYISDKKDRLQKSIEEFSSEYVKGKWSEEDLNKSINSLVDKNNAQLAVLDDKGMTKFVNTYKMVVETEEGQKVSIPLESVAYLEQFHNLDLKIGSEITAEGVFIDAGNKDFNLFSVMHGDKQLQAAQGIVASVAITSVASSVAQVVPFVPSKTVVGENKKSEVSVENRIAISSAKPLEMQKIKGRITELYLPSSVESLALYKRGMLWGAINDWVWSDKSKKTINSDHMVVYDYFDVSSGEKCVVFVKPVIANGGMKELIFAVTSLQPVGEAVNVMKEYYIYVILIAIVVIFALSIIYSRMIAKPLIDMNKVAARMANMDFSAECRVSSDNEIGCLASNLNTLSRNLDNSIKELKAANVQLSKDIERERELEIIRKEFVSNVSHELKTPLGVIQAFAEGLKDGIAIEKKDSYIDVILEETGKMNRLVLDMLELSKLESKALKLDISSFPITDLVIDTVNRFSNSIIEKSIQIRYSFENDNVYILADETRIEQVLANLISNAVRHTVKDGWINIGISCGDGYVNVSIENCGEKIPECKLDRIWDRFYRLEESRDRKSGGTGLGLFIVKNILEMHQSSYQVKNTENGVMFQFTLADGNMTVYS